MFTGLTQLGWEEFGDLKGGAWKRAFAVKVAEMLEDIQSAPDVETARKLTIEVSLKPNVHEGEVVSVGVDANFKTSLPKRGMSLVCLIDSEAGVPCLAINMENTSNPLQRPLFPKNTPAASDVDDED